MQVDGALVGWLLVSSPEIGVKERVYLNYNFITHEADPKLSFTLCTVIAPFNSCELEI